MNPLETKQLMDNVYVIKDDFVNMYIIKNSDHYIAIDAVFSRMHITIILVEWQYLPMQLIISQKMKKYFQK